MASKMMTIGQVSKMIGVSIQTLRRWDDAGRLLSVRQKTAGHRYYTKDSVEDYIKEHLEYLFKVARNWAMSDSGFEPLSDFYCPDSSVFQARLTRLENELGKIEELNKIFPLISAITGEIGSNSFDHNLGNWPDIPGIFFAYDLNKRRIVLADRGRGILATLKRVRPELANDQDALHIAFTEVISGRSPESRGNGLKFVKNVVMGNKMSLIFQTNRAQLRIKKNDANLDIKKTATRFHGCLALIKF